MQKLSYRDRIVILIVLSVAILFSGFTLFIKPKFKEISTAENSLKTAQTQWDELESKIQQVDKITERVQKKYDESVEIGNLFVNLKRAYTLERFIQEYINKNGIYINTNASFSDPTVVALEPYKLDYKSLDYSIGKSADMNSPSDESSDASSEDSQEDEIQNLPCGTITIDYYATRAGLMQFMKDIKESEKSIELKSLTISNNSYSTDPAAILTGDMTIDVYYAEMISDLNIGVEIENTTDAQQ